jgi:hypothetical protein
MPVLWGEDNRQGDLVTGIIYGVGLGLVLWLLILYVLAAVFCG